MSRRVNRAFLPAVLLSVLLLAGCGGESAAALTEAETTFLSSMVPHHEQAIEMAELVEGRSERPELNELAASIVSSQEEEITTMQGLLDDSGEDGMSSMDHGGMPGMMSEEDMTELESLAGADFEAAFLQMMTAHHQGAIEMAEEVLAAEPSSEVQELAQGVIAEQEGEIAQMREWQEAWGA